MCSGFRMSLFLSAVRLQLVGVVGNQHFLLADELPVVALGAAVVDVELVGGAQAVGGGARVVEGDVRRAPHASLARVVQPGAAVLLGLVERLVHQQDLAREPRRRGRLLQEIDDHVVETRLGRTRQVVGEVRLVVELDQRVVAAAGHRRLVDVAAGHVGAIAQDVVPEHLDAFLRDRERRPADRAGHAVAAGRELGARSHWPRIAS